MAARLIYPGMLFVALIPARAAMPASAPASATTKTTAATGTAAAVDPHAAVIRFLETRTRQDPDDVTALNRLAAEYLDRFRRTGDDHDIALAARMAEQSLKSVPAAQNSAALAAKARAAFALHGFAAARDIGLTLVQQEPGKQYPFEILGDAQLELGDYDQAAKTYQAMCAAAGEAGQDSINIHTRLARLSLVRGDLAAARDHFDAAIAVARASSTPAPDMLAWCLVQAGQLAFSMGDWETADKQYRAALNASPTDWPAIDHLAELAAARKQYDAAIALYEPLIKRIPRPELMQNLGDVYAAMNKPDQAKQWHDRALEKYLAAASQGSAHYYHHLAGFYSDTQPNPEEAIRWARRDMEIRHSVYAYDSLAWALYQAGQNAPAAAAMDNALAQNTRDTHLLYHASLIYFRAGDGIKARDCLKRAMETNPHFTEFHVHR